MRRKAQEDTTFVMVVLGLTIWGGLFGDYLVRTWEVSPEKFRSALYVSGFLLWAFGGFWLVSVHSPSEGSSE